MASPSGTAFLLPGYSEIPRTQVEYVGLEIEIKAFKKIWPFSSVCHSLSFFSHFTFNTLKFSSMGFREGTEFLLDLVK